MGGGVSAAYTWGNAGLLDARPPELGRRAAGLEATPVHHPRCSHCSRRRGRLLVQQRRDERIGGSGDRHGDFTAESYGHRVEVTGDRKPQPARRVVKRWVLWVTSPDEPLGAWPDPGDGCGDWCVSAPGRNLWWALTDSNRRPLPCKGAIQQARKPVRTGLFRLKNFGGRTEGARNIRINYRAIIQDRSMP